MQVRPRIKRVVGLTGTPASNGLMDLWAEFKVIDMGKRLGRFITYYRQEYFMPDAMNGQIVYSYRPKPGAEQAIYRKSRISPFDEIHGPSEDAGTHIQRIQGLSQSQ